MSDKKLNKIKLFIKNRILDHSEKNCVAEGMYKNSPKYRRIFNKRGSSLILAMVAIALIAILSTLTLTLALNAYQASVQNKWADEDFYYCEECLEDVYGIIVGSANDIFINNYKQVTSIFAKDDFENINRAFREGVLKDLNSLEENEASTVYTALRRNSEGTDADGNIIGIIEVSYNDSYKQLFTDRYVFKDVNVQFFNSSRGNGQRRFYASITTDMVVYIPNLGEEKEQDYKGSLDYVIVSGGNTTISGDSTIKGNVYSGTDLIVNENSNVTFLSDYITVCNQFKNNGTLSVSGYSSTANIWCRDFVLPESTTATPSSSIISGNLFVNDDMEINDEYCTVQIAGKYYGYGDGTKETKYTDIKGATSTEMNSAILVNGKGTLLDMLNIEELVLSGHSFFPVDGTNQYEGSESLATLVAQSIYMVNEEYINFVARKVSVGGKEVDFSTIKLSNGKTLIDLLTSGYTLVTGGVNIGAVEDKTSISENNFVTNYIDSTNPVTLGIYSKDGKNYCSLYWNFKNESSFKDTGADIVHSDYIVNSKILVGGEVIVNNINDIILYHNGSPFLINGEQISFGKIISNDLITDKHNNVYIFNDKYGKKLESGITNFKNNYLVDDNPVNAVLVSTESNAEDVYNYDVYLQWNFDSSKTANKNKGDIFISACIKAGLVDGFLEKFMDGGYIQISPDANVGSASDLYEYVIQGEGYVAKEFGSSDKPLFDSSLFAENMAESYKWYRTTLIPEEYNPFGAFKSFDDAKFNNNDKYSIFNRKSYYYINGEKTDTYYMNFNTIQNGIATHTIVSSEDGKYKNLIINGDLTITDSGWNGGAISPVLEGIIFVNGNVNISADIEFKGMIISDGEVSISKGTYIKDEKILEGCLEVLKNDQNTKWWSLVSDEFYTKRTKSNTASSSLNAADCIKYENWTRNRDE